MITHLETLKNQITEYRRTKGILPNYIFMTIEYRDAILADSSSLGLMKCNPKKPSRFYFCNMVVIFDDTINGFELRSKL